ncbi:Haloacid dehalogenase-like hydrolase, partial [Trachipleistophora hominis]
VTKLMFPFYIFMGTNISYIPELLCKNEEILVFDLDSTLYQTENYIYRRIEECAIKYLEIKFGEKKARNLMDSVSSISNSVLKGLLMTNSITYDEYHECIFSMVNYEDLIRRDDRLIRLLENIQKPLFIMSNGTKAHVKRVLEILGIEHLFRGVFYVGYDCGNYIRKPSIRAFMTVEKLTRAKKIHFFDDKQRNIDIAALLKWVGYTVDESGIYESLKRINTN